MANSKLTESRILADSIEGLKDLLGNVAAGYNKPPIRVASIGSNWTQREIQQQYGDVVYPYIGLTLQRLARNFESYNYNLRRLGIPIISTDSNQIIIYRLIPTIAGFRVRYMAQSQNDVVNFASRWQLRQKDTRFLLTSSNFKLIIKVKLTDDITIPDQENTEGGNTFSVDTECTMETYIGETELMTKPQKLSTTINLWDKDSQQQVSTEPTIIKNITDAK